MSNEKTTTTIEVPRAELVRLIRAAQGVTTAWQPTYHDIRHLREAGKAFTHALIAQVGNEGRNALPECLQKGG